MSNGNSIHFGPASAVGARMAVAASVGQPVAEAPDSAARLPLLPWFAAPAWGAALCGAYALLAVAPVVILHGLRHDAGHSTAEELGINCALAGFTLLSMQFVLTARLRWIEAPFGLDLIMQFHRAMAIFIVGLLCAHPLLIADSHGWTLLTRWHAHWPIWAGRIVLGLLLLQIAAALFRRAMRLPYERWRQMHTAIAAVVMPLGLAHAVKTGDDFESAAGMALWAIAPTVALATLLYSRAIRPWLLARRPYRVQAVKLEAPAVWTITLEAPDGRPLRFVPGQFQFLRFLDSGVPSEEHPFTIASSPTMGSGISLTIKGCGDFTRRLDQVRPGDRATVHGPFGRFCVDLYADEDELVFVAGGVGITPFMSMLRAMRDRRQTRRVTLVYASRTLDDILFAPELVAMESGRYPNLKVIYVLSEPPPWWTGQTGRVDAGRLEHWCGPLGGKAFYLCCPASMNVALVRGLRRRNVSPRRIHCDYFSL